MKTRSQIIKQFRAITGGKFHAFPTTYGYLFTDGQFSLEIFRELNTATIFKGDSIIAG